jgi:hypothetical protein
MVIHAMEKTTIEIPAVKWLFTTKDSNSSEKARKSYIASRAISMT